MSEESGKWKAVMSMSISILADVGQERGKEGEGKEKEMKKEWVENRREESKVRGGGGLWEQENSKVCGQLIIGL